MPIARVVEYGGRKYKVPVVPREVIMGCKVDVENRCFYDICHRVDCADIDCPDCILFNTESAFNRDAFWHFAERNWPLEDVRGKK